MSKPHVGSFTLKHTESDLKKKLTARKEVLTPDIAPLLRSASDSPLEELGSVANKLFQEAKLQLEHSGNIKSSIKETVTDCLSCLYTIALRLCPKSLSPSTTDMSAASSPSAAEIAKEVMAELQKQKESIDAARQEVSFVKEQMDQLNKNIAQSKLKEGVSYATMAAAPKQTTASSFLSQPVHSMVVSSVDAHDTSEDVLSKIRLAVSAKTSGIRVDRLRKARDQKVVLGCQSREELAKVADLLKSGSPTLLTQEVENRDPLLILLNVLNINSDEDILGALKRQNENILGTIPDVDYRASVKFRRKARNPLENHVILQVSPSVWQNVTAAGKVHIDLQRVVAKDQSPLVTCSRCLGYGHGRKSCQESVDTCSHCAGKHLRSACPGWKAGDQPNCRNCQSAGLDRTDHNSFDTSCPIRKKWDALARARVAYC